MNNENFQRLIKSVTLSLIQPTKIEFELLGKSPEKNAKVQIKWEMERKN